MGLEVKIQIPIHSVKKQQTEAVRVAVATENCSLIKYHRKLKCEKWEDKRANDIISDTERVEMLVYLNYAKFA